MDTVSAVPGRRTRRAWGTPAEVWEAGHGGVDGHPRPFGVPDTGGLTGTRGRFGGLNTGGLTGTRGRFGGLNTGGLAG